MSNQVAYLPEATLRDCMVAHNAGTKPEYICSDLAGFTAWLDQHAHRADDGSWWVEQSGAERISGIPNILEFGGACDRR